MPKKQKKYPGSIRKRGDAFQVRLQVRQRTHTCTLRGVTRDEAEAIAEKKAEELQRRAVREQHGLPTTPRFSGLVSAYKKHYLPNVSAGTQRAYRESLKPIAHYWKEQLSDPHVDEVHEHQVLAYLTWRRWHYPDGSRRPRALSNRSLAKDRAVLHRLFKVASKLGYIDKNTNPVTDVDAPSWQTRDPVLLTDRHYEQLLWACRQSHPMLYLWTLVLGETGCRAYSEALHIRWEDVDIAEGFLWLASGTHGRRTKSGKGRWVPMTETLREAMSAHFARFRFAAYDGHRSSWVFHHIPGFKGSYVPGKRIKSMRTRFNRIRDQLDLPEGFVPHDLRHRRATSWIGAGADVVKVKEALGHADLRTTMGYTHLAREHLRSLVDGSDDRQNGVEAAS
jgi:integrase